MSLPEDVWREVFQHAVSDSTLCSLSMHPSVEEVQTVVPARLAFLSSASLICWDCNVSAGS